MDIPYIIVAGGVGKRMNSTEPKQYLEVNGKPIIYYTIKNLYNAGVRKFILVIDLKYKEYISRYIEQLDIDIKFVEGGTSRKESVLNGFKRLDDDCSIVAIHDSVRPFITKEVLVDLEKKIIEDGISGSIPVLPVKNTTKKVKDSLVVKTLKRDNIFSVGTPQLVKVKDYLEAVDILKEDVTDDASILEKAGFKVGVVKGNERGFKITEPFDLEIFKYLVQEE